MKCVGSWSLGAHVTFIVNSLLLRKFGVQEFEMVNLTFRRAYVTACVVCRHCDARYRHITRKNFSDASRNEENGERAIFSR